MKKNKRVKRKTKEGVGEQRRSEMEDDMCIMCVRTEKKRRVIYREDFLPCCPQHRTGGLGHQRHGKAHDP